MPVVRTQLQRQASTTLSRSSYVLYLTLCYMVPALVAWIVTCILNFRPITTGHYGLGKDTYYSIASKTYVKNERWYRVARTLQSIVGLFTISLTSAVCSGAAVIFVQRHRDAFGLSIRQGMALADKGWTDPAIYARIFLGSDGWKRYGSSFLLMAMLINILGGAISPLREIFLSSTTIKTPTEPVVLRSLLDIPDQWDREVEKSRNAVVFVTRNALQTASNTQP